METSDSVVASDRAMAVADDERQQIKREKWVWKSGRR